MSNVIQLRSIKSDPFCSLIIRIDQGKQDETVIRLKPPIALILGLDELTVNYITDLIHQYNTLRKLPNSGILLDEIQWRDTTPDVYVGSSEPLVRDIINQLIDQPVILQEGTVPFMRANAEEMTLSIDDLGVSWDFHVEGSHYFSHPIPVKTFAIAKERYAR